MRLVRTYALSIFPVFDFTRGRQSQRLRPTMTIAR